MYAVRGEMDRLAESFACAQVDTDKEPALTRQYGVSGLPLTLLLSPYGHGRGHLEQDRP